MLLTNKADDICLDHKGLIVRQPEWGRCGLAFGEPLTNKEGKTTTALLVIVSAMKNRKSAVELFQQNQPDKLVGKSQRR